MPQRLDHERINRYARAKGQPQKIEFRQGTLPAPSQSYLTDVDAARAVSAWLHYRTHGDLSLAQRLCNDLPADMRHKFFCWLKGTAPVTLKFSRKTGYTLIKKRDNGVIFDEERALACPFWEYVEATDK